MLSLCLSFYPYLADNDKVNHKQGVTLEAMHSMPYSHASKSRITLHDVTFHKSLIFAAPLAAAEISASLSCTWIYDEITFFLYHYIGQAFTFFSWKKEDWLIPFAFFSLASMFTLSKNLVEIDILCSVPHALTPPSPLPPPPLLRQAPGLRDWFTSHVCQCYVGGTQTIHSCSLRCGLCATADQDRGR